MTRLPYLALGLAGACWSLGFPLGKVALQEIGAPHLILLRFALAGLIALPVAVGSAKARALFRSPAVLGAGALYGVAFLVQFEGLARTSVALSALLVGAMPALIAIAAFVMREPVSRTTWIGVIAATAGAALIAGKPGAAGTPFGVFLCLVALLVFLAWLLVLRRAPKGADPLAITAVSMVVAAVTVAPIALIMEGAPPLALSTSAWLSVAGQAVLATCLATAAWQWGSARVSSASAGVFINIEPLMGAVIGVAAFGDPLTLALGLGGLLIMGGSLGVVLGERGAPSAGQQETPPPTPA